MRKIIIFFSVLFCVIAQADEYCQTAQDSASPKGSADDFGEKISLIVSNVSDDSTVKVQAGGTYLSSIQDSVNFKEMDAKDFIASINPICENSNLEAKFRSKACIVVSGLHGKLGQKLGISGISDAKQSYQYLQKSLELDPDNEDAINGHAFAIIGLSEQGFIVRKLAEKTLNAKISDEALKAKSNLERIKKTDGLLYKQILKII